MNGEETWARWQEVQASGNPAREWNKWANGLLQEKKELEASGKWESQKWAWEERAKVDFSRGIFNERAVFGGFLFPGITRFFEVKFRCYAEFSGANFKENAYFEESSFEGELWFGGAVFEGLAWFRRATFNGCVQWGGQTFEGHAMFEKASFLETCEFINCTFEKGSIFDDATFKKGVHFTGSTWNKRSSFRNTIFTIDPSPQDPSSAFFDHAAFKEAAIFDKAVFGKVSFYGALVDRAFSMSGARFLSVPNFIQASFKEPPRLDDMVVLPLLSKGEREKRLEKIREEIKSREEKRQKSLSVARDAEDTREEESAENPAPSVPLAAEKRLSVTTDYDDEAKYRALRRVAIVAHDHEKEMDFFAGEILARRAKPEWWKNPMMWVSYPYQWFSDFGRSMFLPLAWMFAVWMVFAAGYGFGGSIGAECGPASSALELSFRRMFFAFDRGGQRMEEIYQCLGGPFVYTEILQSLFSALLIFLFALSVRNHFRIK